MNAQVDPGSQIALIRLMIELRYRGRITSQAPRVAQVGGRCVAAGGRMGTARPAAAPSRAGITVASARTL